LKKKEEIVFSFFGLLIGSVLIDLDHLLQKAYFHWFPVVIFFLFFGAGLFLWSRIK